MNEMERLEKLDKLAGSYRVRYNNGLISSSELKGILLRIEAEKNMIKDRRR